MVRPLVPLRWGGPDYSPRSCPRLHCRLSLWCFCASHVSTWRVGSPLSNWPPLVLLGEEMSELGKTVAEAFLSQPYGGKSNATARASACKSDRGGPQAVFTWVCSMVCKTLDARFRGHAGRGIRRDVMPAKAGIQDVVHATAIRSQSVPKSWGHCPARSQRFPSPPILTFPLAGGKGMRESPLECPNVAWIDLDAGDIGGHRDWPGSDILHASALERKTAWQKTWSSNSKPWELRR